MKEFVKMLLHAEKRKQSYILKKLREENTLCGLLCPRGGRA